MSFKNARGQVAIFVVLVFQVLFILFAMTINIALVVHDKINFQNSLDMAVYYGAKQQSEVLNAMAHINYQMRQNWKLLAWRYRILGTLLQNGGWHQKSGPQDYWCPQSQNGTFCTLTENDSDNVKKGCELAQSFLNYGNYCDKQYFVCITGNLWKRGMKKSGQNFCTKAGVSIPQVTPFEKPKIPWLADVMEPMLSMNAIGSLKLIEDLQSSCPQEGALNWLTAQLFLSHFRLDQRDRRVMLEQIFEKSLKQGKDLDGQDIFEGAKKVFFNNLTQTNRESVIRAGGVDTVLQDLNSFEGLNFHTVFKPVDVWPVLNYVRGIDLNGPGKNINCSVEIYSHYDLPPSQEYTALADHPVREFQPEMPKLFTLNSKDNHFRTSDRGKDPINSLVLGYIKQKEIVLYYALKANMKYLYERQIFSLSLKKSGLTFKASAFAKPFGGRFGPQPKEMDPLIPAIYKGSGAIPTSIPSPKISGTFLQPNHSRWPGDNWGLIDRTLHANNQSNPYSNFLNKLNGYFKGRTGYTIEDFFHLIFFSSPSDPLVRNPQADKTNPFYFLRMMELMAVWPDLYDISYYSIFGNYMQTYFPRLCKLILGGEGDCQRGTPAISDFEANIRGDFGWPETEDYITANQSDQGLELSIAPYFLKGGGTQLNTSRIPNPPKDLPSRPNSAIAFGKPEKKALSQGRIFYPWLAQELPAHLLSSWTPAIDSDGDKLDYETYKLPPSSFLNCHGSALERMPSETGCVKGGRSGYSVKLISCAQVNSFPGETPRPDVGYCP